MFNQIILSSTEMDLVIGICSFPEVWRGFCCFTVNVLCGLRPLISLLRITCLVITCLGPSLTFLKVFFLRQGKNKWSYHSNPIDFCRGRTPWSSCITLKNKILNNTAFLDTIKHNVIHIHTEESHGQSRRNPDLSRTITGSNMIKEGKEGLEKHKCYLLDLSCYVCTLSSISSVTKIC